MELEPRPAPPRCAPVAAQPAPQLQGRTRLLESSSSRTPFPIRIHPISNGCTDASSSAVRLSPKFLQS